MYLRWFFINFLKLCDKSSVGLNDLNQDLISSFK